MSGLIRTQLEAYQMLWEHVTDIYTAKWRIPIGDSGILNFFLEIFSGHDLRHVLRIHILRVIGNSCADTGQMTLSQSA